MQLSLSSLTNNIAQVSLVKAQAMTCHLLSQHLSEFKGMKWIITFLFATMESSVVFGLFCVVLAEIV